MSSNEEPMKNTVVAYQLFILALSLYAVGAIAFQSAKTLDAETVSLLQYADVVVCVIFFVDFLISLYRAPNRWRYFLTSGWLDLISSIPTLDAARWGRLARVARIIRIIRVIRATKIVATMIHQSRSRTGVLALILTSFLLIVSCSVAVLRFESVAGGNIQTAEDALWWAMTTVTTVGYGDLYPVTDGGRMIAAILMFAGVGLFSTASGLLAAWFLAPSRRAEAQDISQLREELSELRALLQRQKTE